MFFFSFCTYTRLASSSFFAHIFRIKYGRCWINSILFMCDSANRLQQATINKSPSNYNNLCAILPTDCVAFHTHDDVKFGCLSNKNTIIVFVVAYRSEIFFMWMAFVLGPHHFNNIRKQPAKITTQRREKIYAEIMNEFCVNKFSHRKMKVIWSDPWRMQCLCVRLRNASRCLTYLICQTKCYKSFLLGLINVNFHHFMRLDRE